AEQAGLGDDVRAERSGQLAFDSTRSFHAAVVQGRLCVEGAAEVLVPRCDRIIRDGSEIALDERGCSALLARARRLSERGLRVLMVAEGRSDTPSDDPQELVALGFVGISDPLRPEVPVAVRRCHEAGVRVIMLTGDHPATARAIARDAGLPSGDQQILTGGEIAELDSAELDRRLAEATIIARATPLDKVRIIEGLQRLGHTVAMTGDGINDAPALRLADVGVAMGRGGTEVARQAADVVLSDDNFSTLVETFVEGRSFWRNIRRALGLLLGGNLGELGLQVGASILGLASPLTSRQILTVNLITDVLPALAVALQQPGHHNLAGLAREGTSALDAPLRADILRRAAATGVPTLAAYMVAVGSGGLPLAQTVAFASIVTTQLAQTLDVGWSEEGLSRSVLGAVAGSTGLLVATLTVPTLRGFLGVAMPTPFGLALIGAATLAALLLGRLRSLPSFIGFVGFRVPAIPAAYPAS
ncbi:MAG: HAD-IC family P-type ATPase, partial [Chloroflexota bacterium]|nr:HAD-IC family P-type ATPase [Chloroflexota bacterium]